MLYRGTEVKNAFESGFVRPVPATGPQPGGVRNCNAARDRTAAAGGANAIPNAVSHVDIMQKVPAPR